MQFRFFRTPFPTSARADCNIARGIKTKASQIPITMNIPPVLRLAMPQMQERARHIGYSGAHLAVNGPAPGGEVSPMRLVVSEDPADAAPVPISGEGMRHHMIAATGHAPIVKSVRGKNFPARCPCETGVAMLRRNRRRAVRAVVSRKPPQSFAIVPRRRHR